MNRNHHEWKNSYHLVQCDSEEFLRSHRIIEVGFNVKLVNFHPDLRIGVLKNVFVSHNLIAK